MSYLEIMALVDTVGFLGIIAVCIVVIHVALRFYAYMDEVEKKYGKH